MTRSTKPAVSSVRLSVLLALVVGAISLPVAARDGLPSLPDYRLLIGDPASMWGQGPVGEAPDGYTASPGRWSVTLAPIRDGRVDVHLVIEPPAWSLPVEAGPAVLFTALALGGGVGGDVGYERLVSLESTGLDACIGDPCTFETSVTVDLRRLPRIARRVGRLQEVWAEVGFTLIRTYAGGTWIQALETVRPNGTIFSGTLRAPEPWSATLPPTGLYPANSSMGWRDDRPDEPFDYLAIMEAERGAAGDRTHAIPATDVRVIATFHGCTGDDFGAFGASLRTSDGDRVVIPRARRYDFVDATVGLPVGTSWRIGWEPEPGSSFAVGTSPLLVAAVYRCDDDGVSVEDVTVGAVMDQPSEPWASPGV